MTYRLHWLPAPTPTVTSKQRASQQQLVQALKNTFQKQVQYTPELSIHVLGTS
jgi:hypothetical protein